MAHMRRVLAPLITFWLFSQIGTVALVPVALWISAADPHAAECTCEHGTGAMCPMHHKPAKSAAPCALQAANTPEGTALTTLVGTAGLVPEPVVSIGRAPTTSSGRRADARAVGRRPVPPDPPPPRA